jgi:hypothetical protein
MKKIGRNDPCLCGSGKKYKKCCGNPINPSRVPGLKIKRTLRQRVNYGCPVRFPDGNGCGCPILTYHHFDPPWAGNFKHNPDGMIALCSNHHDMADSGKWTKEQLREMNVNPYIDDKIKIRWPWTGTAESILMKVGKCLIIGKGSPIKFRNNSIMHFRPEKIESFGCKTTIYDSNILDEKQNEWLKIEDGWLDLSVKNTSDLLFTPSTNIFFAKHEDSTFVELKYKQYKIDKLSEYLNTFMKTQNSVDNLLKSIEKKKLIDSDERVTIISVNGRFVSPECEINIQGDKLRYISKLPDKENFIFQNSVVVDEDHSFNFCFKNGDPFFSIG